MRSMFAAAVIASLLVVPALAADDAPMPRRPQSAAAPTAPAAMVPGPAPDGATAICKDGTYTMSHSYSGACSSHHGVTKWLRGI
jgi:Protein of unknown function (DUF3761)